MTTMPSAGMFEEEKKMGTRTRDSRGFTLVAALLLTLLLSALALGLFYLVDNEQHMGSNDLEGNLAYYGAESGIENLTAQLSALYQSSPSPSASALCALVTPGTEITPTQITGSNITSMNYVESLGWTSGTSAVTCPTTSTPSSNWDIVGAGPNQGMVATMINYNLQVTATRLAGAGEATNNAGGLSNPTGASINLTRTVQMALLPAFEFGIFCAYDCDYFAGPPFNFGGRVHVNGNLFLGSQSTLTFTDKIAAAGQIVMDRLENGNSTSADGYNDPVYAPAAAGACPAAPGAGPATNCVQIPAGSWTGGFPPVGTANPAWKGISTTTFNSFVINGLTGATTLQLPFMQGSAVGAIDIIRKPTPGDTPLLTSSRLYNQATIRILLADTEGDLYPGETRSDSSTQDIQLGTPFTNNTWYVKVPTVATGNGVSAGYMYFATAKKSTNQWLAAPPTGCSGTLTSWPLFGQVTSSSPNPLCSGAWLRVEYLNSSQQWVGITTEWLGFGFGRGYDAPPTHPYSTSTGTVPYCQNYNGSTFPAGQCQNGISPAILILQQLQSLKGPANSTEADTTDTSQTAYNWIPINFYDAREGEPRDSRPGSDTNLDCSPNGIMNTVELDVGNLWLWLQGAAPYTGFSGPKVSIINQYGVQQNGYILYFGDHRGMLPDKYPLTTFNNGFSGMSGLNDVVNSAVSNGLPDGKLEPMTYYTTATPVAYSPEDPAVKGAVINKGNVETWGETYLGAGFGLSGAAESQPYYIAGTTSNPVVCYSTTGSPSAEWNMVSGPRHVLRLVDGGMSSGAVSYLPPTNGTPATNGGGFTIASEEPVYVLGDYNTGANDPFWPSENTTTTPHSAAAIIADTVTLLSNPPANNTTPTANVGWTDQESFTNPSNIGSETVSGKSFPGRPANTSWYRMAIASGKSIPWPSPTWAASNDVGTDGGMHNFLRYLENRGANGAQVNYAGSMISMYYSQYDTGMFKCCNAVYGAPGKRNYFFDTLFLNPNNLPPGTPMFQEVESLSYHQNFTPQ